MDVDQEIDELLSESDHAAPSSPARQEDPDVNTDCKWDDCCEACNTVEEIAQHLTEVHIPEKKPYICYWAECPRKGSEQNSKFALTTHCRSHTGEKPFVCNRKECARAFMRNDALQKHLRQHDQSDKTETPMPVVKKTRAKPKPRPSDQAGPSAGPSAVNTASNSKHPSPRLPSPALPSIPKVEPHTSVLGPVPVTATLAVPPIQDAPPRPVTPAFPKAPNPAMLVPHEPAFNYDWNEAILTGLYEDSDLKDVIANLRSADPFWTVTAQDLLAHEEIRRRFPHKIDPELPSDDEFDEGVQHRFPPRPELIQVMEDQGTELHMLSRPRWQVKYVMAKAKLMLVEEENRMRRRQLKEWGEREEMMSKGGATLADFGPYGQSFADAVQVQVKKALGSVKDEK